MSRRDNDRATREVANKTVEKGEERGFVRQQLGQTPDKLTCPDVPGYHVHVINDNNVPDALSRGYRFLEESYIIGDKVVGSTTQSGSIMTFDVGGGITGYVMILQDEWRAEDDNTRKANVLSRSREVLDKIQGDEYYGKVTTE